MACDDNYVFLFQLPNGTWGYFSETPDIDCGCYVDVALPPPGSTEKPSVSENCIETESCEFSCTLHGPIEAVITINEVEYDGEKYWCECTDEGE